LTSAIVWGTGDFSGGVATRKIHPFQALALTSLTGLILLVALALAMHEPFPTPASLFWSSVAGFLGAFGIAALYRGLALGNTALVAPTAAVVGAALPVLVGGLLEGAPRPNQMAGFPIGLLGIWLVSRVDTGESPPNRLGLWLGILAGAGFGGFFVAIAQVKPGAVFAPLAVSKVIALIVACLILGLRRMKFPSPAGTPVALLAGLLDAGGNIFYLLAKQYTRLDVAAVLSSMYPAATVILARLVYRETASRSQGWGVLFCLAAVGLIVM